MPTSVLPLHPNRFLFLLYIYYLFLPFQTDVDSPDYRFLLIFLFLILATHYFLFAPCTIFIVLLSSFINNTVHQFVCKIKFLISFRFCFPDQRMTTLLLTTLSALTELLHLQLLQSINATYINVFCTFCTQKSVQKSIIYRFYALWLRSKCSICSEKFNLFSAPKWCFNKIK